MPSDQENCKKFISYLSDHYKIKPCNASKKRESIWKVMMVKLNECIFWLKIKTCNAIWN